jgi:hypothetical protein
MATADRDSSSRLDALEREVRKLSKEKNLAIVFSALILLFVLVKDVAIAVSSRTITAETISAKRIVVEGKHGTPVIVLGYDIHDAASLRFYDPWDRNLLGLGVTANGGAFVGFHDSDGQKRAGMSVGPLAGKTVSDLYFCGPREKPYLQMGVTSEQDAGIWLLDGRSHVGMSLSMNPDGGTQFRMRDPDERRGIHLQTDPTADPTLALVGKNGQTYCLTPAGSEQDQSKGSDQSKGRGKGDIPKSP